MLVTYKIDAVHPTFKRVIESGLTPDEMTELYKSLQKAGYEDKDIDLVKKEIYQAGDTIKITKAMFDTLPDNVKETIGYMFSENRMQNPSVKFPIKGIVNKKRLDNKSGQLIIKWQNANSTFKETNTYFLAPLFKFEEPIFEVIPIQEANDDLLDINDLIIKYLMKENDWSEDQSRKYILPIQNAMKKAEAVFYQP